MSEPSKFDPAVLKSSMVTGGGKLKPSLVKPNYTSGAGSASTLKSSLLSGSELKPSLTKVGQLKPSLLRGGRGLSKPDGFNGSHSLSVRESGGSFTVDFDFDEPTWGTAYYVGPGGDDSNSGLTYANRLATITEALTRSSSMRIYAHGDYHHLEFVPSNGRLGQFVSGGRQVALLPYEDNPLRAINGPKKSSLTWTSQGSGRYTAPQAQTNIYAVLDETNLDEFGNPTPLVERSSATEVINNGGWYIVGSTLSVKTADGSDPTENVQVIYELTGQTQPVNLYSRDFYAKSIQMLGWGIFNQCTGAFDYISRLVGCSTISAVDEDGFSFSKGGATLSHKAYSKDCLAAYCVDNFDYSNGNDALEVNATSYQSGYFGAINGPNQCSTAHNSTNIIRVGGVYQQSASANIADVSGSHAWNIGCVIRNSRGTGSDSTDVLASGSGTKAWNYKTDMSGSSSTRSFDDGGTGEIFQDSAIFSGASDASGYTQD